ncbi:MAG: preprotein translocase subunit SecG [Gammaproteobacteria bacterium]|nr:preprotein translocase subunit SecG [Gammaproteobacteria bacterium]
MQEVVLIVHLLAAAGLVGLILIQQGKGADMGAAFGAGASGTVFGSQGAGSFITRSTAVLATTFFLTSLALAYFSGQVVSTKSVTEMVIDTPAPVMAEQKPVAEDLPVLPVESAAPVVEEK